jgi:hypothetical protein
MLMVERLGHKVVERWQRSSRVDKTDALLRGMVLSMAKRLVKELYGCGCQEWSC